MFSFNDIMPTYGGTLNIKPVDNGKSNNQQQKQPININKLFESSPKKKINETNKKPLVFENKPLISSKNINKDFKMKFKDEKNINMKSENNTEKKEEIDNPKLENPLNTRESLFLPIDKIDRINAPKEEIPEQIESRYMPIKEVVYEIPRVENRFISLAENPYQDINRLNFLYEDFIPEPLMPNKITTVVDRFNLWDFINLNVMNLFIDGYNTDKKFIGHAEKSLIDALSDYDNVGLAKLFSKVKSLKFNPNVLDRTRDVSFGFQIYNSCYPIKRDGNSVKCSNIGQILNLRIYQTPLLTFEGKLKVFNKNNEEIEVDGKYLASGNNDLDIDYTHIGREFEFYKYIKEFIVQKKESPNFPICYGIIRNLFDASINFNTSAPLNKISIDEETMQIDKDFERFSNEFKMFLKFYKVKSGLDNLKNFEKQLNKITEEYEDLKHYYTDKHKLTKHKIERLAVIKDTLKDLFKYFSNTKFNYNNFRDWLNNTDKEEIKLIYLQLDNTDPSSIIKIKDTELNKVISFSLTEAPDLSFDEWTHPQTIKQFGVSKMLESGWHTSEEKEIFMFELIYAFIILLRHRIFIPDFGINNIFIKKIISQSNLNKLFVYEIDNIKFYIPNLGFYVMIDERYAGNIGNNINNIYKDNKDNDIITQDGDDAHIETMFNNMLNIIDIVKQRWPGIFTEEINENIIRLISKKNDNFSKLDILKTHLIVWFKKYANNRCGTVLSQDEFRNIESSIQNLINYQSGDLVLELIENGLRYNIVQIVNKYSNDNDNITIISRDPYNKLIIKEVELINCKSFNNSSAISQIKDKYERYSENVLETYKTSTNDEDISPNQIWRNNQNKIFNKCLDIFNKMYDLLRIFKIFYNDPNMNNIIRTILNKYIKILEVFYNEINKYINEHDINKLNDIFNISTEKKYKQARIILKRFFIYEKDDFLMMKGGSLIEDKDYSGIKRYKIIKEMKDKIMNDVNDINETQAILTSLLILLQLRSLNKKLDFNKKSNFDYMYDKIKDFKLCKIKEENKSKLFNYYNEYTNLKGNIRNKFNEKLFGKKIYKIVGGGEKTNKTIEELKKLLSKSKSDEKKICDLIFKLIKKFYDETEFLFNKKDCKMYYIIKKIFENDNYEYFYKIFMKLKNKLGHYSIKFNHKTFINLVIEYIYGNKNYIRINDKEKMSPISLMNIPLGISFKSSINPTMAPIHHLTQIQNSRPSFSTPSSTTIKPSIPTITHYSSPSALSSNIPTAPSLPSSGISFI